MKEIKDTKEIQKYALDILKFVDKVCKENNLTYSLAGGTLLGAVRHKGFIPWDDDVDIMMPRQDYDKFLKIMDKTPHEKYQTLHFDPKLPNYFYCFTKVVDKSTFLQESEYIAHENMGIFIDIFPVDGIIINKKIKILKKVKFYRALTNLASYKKIPRKNVGFFKYIIKRIVSCFAKIGGYKHWRKKYEKYVTSFNYNSCEYVIPYSGAYGEKDIFPKDFFNNLILLDFEDSKFSCIANYDYYLTSLYKDYMTPPPKEKQISHHDLKIYKR